MLQHFDLLRLVLAMCAMVYAAPSIPQVPPHYPGTICFTPYFWCQLPGALPVGAPCYCNGPYGPVNGRAG